MKSLQETLSENKKREQERLSKLQTIIKKDNKERLKRQSIERNLIILIIALIGTILYFTLHEITEKGLQNCIKSGKGVEYCERKLG